MTSKTTSKHSEIGASSAERWWNCPGSVPLAREVLLSIGDAGRTSKYAAEGTVAHTLAEKYYGNPAGLDAEIDSVMVQDGFEIEVTEEMVEHITTYHDVLNHYLWKLGVDASCLSLEVRFSLQHIHEDAFGTCDAVIRTPSGQIVVLDFKYGQGVTVEVEDNKQLLYYALGAYYDLPESDRADVWSVELVVVQPRARDADTGYRTWAIERSDLQAFETALTEAIHRVRDGSTVTASGDWCKWCSAKPICPTLRQQISEQAALDFAPIETGIVEVPEPHTLEPERVANILGNAERIRDWCDSVLAYGYHLAERGTTIPGYKIVQGRANRRWTDEDTVIRAYNAEFDEDIYAKKLKTPAQFERLLGKKRAGELEKFVTRPEGKRSLVLVDDKREGLPPAIETEFKDVLVLPGGVSAIGPLDTSPGAINIMTSTKDVLKTVKTVETVEHKNS